MNKVQDMLNAKFEQCKVLRRGLAVLDLQGLILALMYEDDTDFNGLRDLTGWSEEKMAEFFDKDADPTLRDVSDVFTTLGKEFRIVS